MNVIKYVCYPFSHDSAVCTVTSCPLIFLSGSMLKVPLTVGRGFFFCLFAQVAYQVN